jgi:hypothetical protein
MILYAHSTLSMDQLTNSGKRAHRLLLMPSTLPSEGHSWPSPRPSQGKSIDFRRVIGLMYRTNQKITKPQFFESYKSERTNISNLDVASAYITKKAIQSSIALSEKDFTTPANEGVWGGLQSRFNLAVEMIPMMIKIQNASGSKYTSMFVGSIS